MLNIRSVVDEKFDKKIILIVDLSFLVPFIYPLIHLNKEAKITNYYGFDEWCLSFLVFFIYPRFQLDEQF